MANEITFQDPDDRYSVEVTAASTDSTLEADIVAYLKTRLAAVPGVTAPVRGYKTEIVLTQV